MSDKFPLMNADISALEAEMGDAQPAAKPPKPKVSAAAPAAPEPAPAAAPAPARTASNRVKIVLDENDDIPPTGLFVSVNGVAYVIRPGEEVDVPPSVLEVLDHAVMSMPHVDPQTQQVIGWRNRMRYPYRRV